MNKRHLKEFKDRLAIEKNRLEKELRLISKDSLEKSQSEMSGEHGYEDDAADMATTTFERERDESLVWNIKDMLNKINDSLSRIKEGTYGICTECSQEISIERLEAIPYAENCLRCQSKKT